MLDSDQNNLEGLEADLGVGSELWLEFAYSSNSYWISSYYTWQIFHPIYTFWEDLDL